MRSSSSAVCGSEGEDLSPSSSLSLSFPPFSSVFPLFFFFSPLVLICNVGSTGFVLFLSKCHLSAGILHSSSCHLLPCMQSTHLCDARVLHSSTPPLLWLTAFPKALVMVLHSWISCLGYGDLVGSCCRFF